MSSGVTTTKKLAETDFTSMTFEINPACVFSCIHQAVLFHCHHNTTLIAEINIHVHLNGCIEHTLHTNCEEGGMCELL